MVAGHSRCRGNGHLPGLSRQGVRRLALPHDPSSARTSRRARQSLRGRRFTCAAPKGCRLRIRRNGINPVATPLWAHDLCRFTLRHWSLEKWQHEHAQSGRWSATGLYFRSQSAGLSQVHADLFDPCQESQLPPIVSRVPNRSSIHRKVTLCTRGWSSKGPAAIE